MKCAEIVYLALFLILYLFRQFLNVGKAFWRIFMNHFKFQTFMPIKFRNTIGRNTFFDK